MIKNFLTAIKKRQRHSHGGEGVVDLYEIWRRHEYRSGVGFTDRVVVPADSTIGFHTHGNNEETYIILEGQGMVNIGNRETAVGKGDMILNPAGGGHGLENRSEADIDLLVIQIGLGE